MPRVKINTNDFDLNEVLAGISQLNMEELQKVMHEVSTYIASKKAPSLSEKEAQLILKINEGLPQAIQQRYNDLQQKLVQENISETEHRELLQLTSRAEAKTVERLAFLMQLAALWKISLDETMNRLDIKPPPSIHA